MATMSSVATPRMTRYCSGSATGPRNSTPSTNESSRRGSAPPTCRSTFWSRNDSPIAAIIELSGSVPRSGRNTMRSLMSPTIAVSTIAPASASGSGTPSPRHRNNAK